MAGCAGWKEMRALINSKHKAMVDVIRLVFSLAWRPLLGLVLLLMARPPLKLSSY